ncbi:MAG: hypothetical protein DRI46_10615, partial [Chloroflexi bacterium]
YDINGELTAIYDSSNDWVHDNLTGVGYRYIPGDGVLEGRITTINDIFVTEGTSVNGGNVLFLGTNRGTSLIEENRGSEAVCERKWFYVGNLSTNYKWLITYDGARMYSDGTYANSAYEYRHPAVIYTRYTGDTGDGWYWVLPEGQDHPIKMYCDMTTEGGGFDYYPIDSGISTNVYTDNNSGKAYGLDLVIPRSKVHWTWMLNYYGTSYFATIPGIYNPINAGNYTAYAMRDPNSYASGPPNWTCLDGGRWWIRDTTYGEPNGDYRIGSWLGMQGWNVNALAFNDLSGGYTTSKYLCSTNKKP